MEQWFSLMGIEDEEQIWNILTKNPYAMNKLRKIASGGTMVLSDMLTEWELGIGALQSTVIRRIKKYCEDEKNNKNQDDKNDNTEKKKEEEQPKNDENTDKINGNVDESDAKEDK